jgi:uncharacterized membrane protein YfcA
LSLILVILVIGFLAQFIDGTLGMGYGASSASFLVSCGLIPALVSASVHTSEIFASFASGVSHFKSGNVSTKIAIPLTSTGVIGGVIGALFLVSLPVSIVTPIVAIILLILGGRILTRFIWGGQIKITKGEHSRSLLLPLGLIGGMVDAIGGGGWGPICTSTLVNINKEEPHYVIGSVNISEFFTTIAIVVTFGLTIGFENFLWFITIPLIIGGVIAAPIAAYTCRRVPSTLMGMLVGSILIVLNTRTLAKSLPEFLGLPILVSPDVIALLVIMTIAVLVLSCVWVRRKKGEGEAEQPSSAKNLLKDV